MNGLNLNIQEKIEVTRHETLNYITDLALKYERQLKRTIEPYQKNTNQLLRINEPRNKPPPPPRNTKENDRNWKEKGVVGASDKNKKRCFRCQGIGHFTSDCPNQRVLTI